METLSPGSILAGYRIEAVAGHGGMGIVYRATQLGLDRPVAIKLIAGQMADDLMFRERFKRESQLAASIDHPNVIPIYEAGEAEGRLFIAMRYVDGTDLSTVLSRGPLEPERAIETIAQIAAALDAAHRGGLVHRDVKPANVLITEDEEAHVYLTDFGLTKHTTSAGGLTKTGQMVGTLDYIPPEQIEGKRAEARTDVYALGCVLFHALTGHPPFERENDVATIYAHLTDAPPELEELVSGLPAALSELIQRAMAKDPEDRFPSAGDLARAGLAALEKTPTRPPERSVAKGGAAPAGDAEAAPAAAAEAPPAPPFDVAEAKLLQRYRAGEVALAPDDGEEMERLLGGVSPPERLGLPGDADPAAVRTALLDAIDRWQRRAEHPLSSRPVVDAARIVVRTCEAVLASLPQPPPGS